MENKKTLVTIRVFFIIKVVLVIAGFINVVITLFSASAKEAPVGTFLLAYICLMIHAVWAYKKASIFYHAAGILSFTAIVTLIGKINQNVGGLISGGHFLVIILAGATLLFILTFRKYEKTATVAGFIMVIASLAYALVTLFTGLASGTDAASLAGELPFASFVLNSTLFITFMSRLTWKKAGKQDTAFI